MYYVKKSGRFQLLLIPSHGERIKGQQNLDDVHYCRLLRFRDRRILVLKENHRVSARNHSRVHHRDLLLLSTIHLHVVHPQPVACPHHAALTRIRNGASVGGLY